ncbi:MAG: diguanylate cyclase [bacterium]
MNIYKSFLDNLFDAAYVVDKNKKILYWNKAAEEISGFSASEVIGTRCADNVLSHIDFVGLDLCKSGCPLHSTLQDGEKREAIVFLHHKEGHRIPVYVRISPIRNKKDEIIGAIEVFSEHSKDTFTFKELERQTKESLSDPLLKIGNRRYAERMFDVRQTEMRISGRNFGVVFIDIDYFKSVNDKHGHDVGDKVLLMVTRTIANLLRKNDTLARWGGDELLILLPQINTEKELVTIADRIKTIVQSAYLTLDDENISVSVSLGATLSRHDDTLESVLKRVDTLMYDSKENGRNQYTLG